MVIFSPKLSFAFSLGAGQSLLLCKGKKKSSKLQIILKIIGNLKYNPYLCTTIYNPIGFILGKSGLQRWPIFL